MVWKPLILCVDDTPSILEGHKSLLEENGYRVPTATNGTDAVLQVRGQKEGILKPKTLRHTNSYDVVSVNGASGRLTETEQRSYTKAIGAPKSVPLQSRPATGTWLRSQAIFDWKAVG